MKKNQPLLLMLVMLLFMPFVSMTVSAGDASIVAVYAPLNYDSETETISAPEGATVELLLNRVRPGDTSAEFLLDADKNDISENLEDVVAEGMYYRVVAEDETTVDYVISIYTAEVYTYSAVKIMDEDPIAIDEDFEDWDAIDDAFAVEVFDETLEVPTDETDFSVTMKMAWDDTNLYVYWKVLDEVINVNTESSWNYDGIELALVMTETARADYNMFWNAANQKCSMKFMYLPGESYQSMFDLGLNTSATMRDPDGGALADELLSGDEAGYQGEFMVPWATLNGFENTDPFIVEEGSEFSFNLAINDNDGGDTRASILYLVNSNTNFVATDYPYMRLDPEKPYVPEGPGEAVNQNELMNISVYPNPVSDYVQISGMNNVEYIEISNIAGQVVQRFENFVDADLTLNVSSLTQGVYIINALSSEGSVSTAKFIKR